MLNLMLPRPAPNVKRQDLLKGKRSGCQPRGMFISVLRMDWRTGRTFIVFFHLELKENFDKNNKSASCSKLFTPFLSLPSHQLCSMSSSLSCAMSLVPILITLKPFRPWTTTKCCFHLLPCFLIIPYHTISYWQRHITHAHLEMAQLLLACNCPPHLHT